MSSTNNLLKNCHLKSLISTFSRISICSALLVLAPLQVNAEDLQPMVVGSWKADVQKTIFPSLILAMTQPVPYVNLKVTPAVPNAKVHVVVDADGIAEESVYDTTLSDAGKTYDVTPTIRWDSRRLLGMFQPIPTTITVSTTINGVSLGQKTIPVRVRAVNDVPFATKTSDGKMLDLSPLFAAFVNENNPVVDRILQEALRWKAVRSFYGYQGTRQDVEMQVFAIWNVLQRHHIKYSSITTASGTTEGVYSQSVRFVDNAFRNQQANCVDGSVLFASVLYKIGISPVLVKIPGHMFVGYYLSPPNQGKPANLQFLETTLVGAGVLPGNLNMGFGMLHPVYDTLSYKQFVQAVNYGNQEYNTKVVPAMGRHLPGFQIIDIAKARAVGINPISH